MSSAAERSREPEAVWKALSDRHRRRMLDLLRDRPRTTGELANQFPVSRFAVMKHLGVLVGAGLVLVERRGRERWNFLNPMPIHAIAQRWIEPFAAARVHALADLKRRIEAGPRGVPEMSKKSDESKDAGSPFGVCEVALEVEIAAPPERVWKAFTEEIAAWWPTAFYTSPDPKGFVFEEKLGGRVYEDRGDGQGLVWYQVTELSKPERIRLSGDLTPEFGGPARLQTRIDFVPSGEGTRFRLLDTLFGRLGANLEQNVAEGWKLLFEGCFKPWVEEGKHPERPEGVG